MSGEIVKFERPALDGEVLPPETERERLTRDPMYFAANLYYKPKEVPDMEVVGFKDYPQVPEEAFQFAGFMQRRMETVTGAGPISGEVVDASKPLRVRTWHPDPLMRRMGYTADPNSCRHFRKAYDPQSGWSCRDCGERNLTQKTRLSL